MELLVKMTDKEYQDYKEKVELCSKQHCSDCPLREDSVDCFINTSKQHQYDVQNVWKKKSLAFDKIKVVIDKVKEMTPDVVAYRNTITDVLFILDEVSKND